MPIVACVAIIYSLGTPLFFYLLVRRFQDRGESGDKVVASALGWIYRPFKEGKAWWFPCEMLRVLLLSATIGFLARTCWTKLLLALFIAFIFFTVFLLFQPYSRKKHTYMQGFAMAVPIAAMGWGLSGGWGMRHQ